jgi:hypothetical protein
VQEDTAVRAATAAPTVVASPCPAASAPQLHTGSSSRPNSSPRRSPKWPCSLDLPDTTSRSTGGWPQNPQPAGPGSQAGGSEEGGRGSRRVTFAEAEQGGPADQEPQHGAAGLRSSVAFPAHTFGAEHSSARGRLSHALALSEHPSLSPPPPLASISLPPSLASAFLLQGRSSRRSRAPGFIPPYGAQRSRTAPSARRCGRRYRGAHALFSPLP